MDTFRHKDFNTSVHFGGKETTVRFTSRNKKQTYLYYGLNIYNIDFMGLLIFIYFMLAKRLTYVIKTAPNSLQEFFFLQIFIAIFPPSYLRAKW